MDDSLQGLVRELRSERCPDSVMEAVARRIGRSEAVARPWWRSPACRWVCTGWVSVLLAGWVALHFSLPPGAAPTMAPSPAATERELVLAQAEVALVGIGRVLIDAGARAEDVFRTEAMPPLMNSFLTAKTKMTHN